MGNLGTVLDRLSGLLSKYFLIGSYFPILIFVFMNCVFLYVINPSFRHLVVSTDFLKESIVGMGILIGASVLAYFLSTMNLALREWLESPRLPKALLDEWILKQRDRRNKLIDKIEDLRKLRRTLRKREVGWDTQLIAARRTGRKVTTPNEYADSLPELGPLALKDRSDLNEVGEVVRRLAEALKLNNIDERDQLGERTPNAVLLDGDEVALRAIIKQIPNQIAVEEGRVYNEIQFNFSRNDADIAPTRMGNIALSVQSYVGSRYHLNFNFFWTRIQNTLQTQAEDKYFTVLCTAKAQLDFHVALFWLACVFALIWTPTSAYCGFSVWLLFSVAVGTPLAAWMFYTLAIQSYRAYADLLRTTVDLYHFKLLDALHIAIPPSVEDEREIWKSVTQWLGQGDLRDIGYYRSAKP